MRATTAWKHGLAGLIALAAVAVAGMGGVAVAASPAGEFHLTEGILNPGSHIDLDVPIGNAGAVSVSTTTHGAVVMDVQGTGDLTAEQRGEEFDAVVAAAYGLDIADPATAAKVQKIYDESSKLARRRRAFVKAKSGEPVRVEFPATID